MAERQPLAQAQALQAQVAAVPPQAQAVGQPLQVQVAAEEPQQSAVLLAQGAQPMIQYLRCPPRGRRQGVAVAERQPLAQERVQARAQVLVGSSPKSSPAKTC